MTETNAYGPRIEGDDYVANPRSTGPVPDARHGRRDT